MNIKSKLPLFLLVGAIMLTQCEDETVHRDYPRITTNSVTNISASGATFVGEILEMGDAPVTEHGFVWSTVSNLNVSTDNKVLLGAFNKIGEFKADISTTLVSNYKYYVCAFVKSGEYLVYGKTVTFESLGSKAPVITDFSPKTASWNDTITVTGRYFSYVPNYNRVYVGSHLVQKIMSVTDTTLKFLLPPTVSEHKNAISVEILGNVTTLKKDSLTFLEPEIIYYSPKTARWGDTVSFYGKHLKSFSYMIENGIYFGSLKAIANTKMGDTLVKAIVPNHLSTITSPVTIKLNGFSLNYDTLFTLLPPKIDSIRPKSGTWGSTITLYGKFNSGSGLGNVNFNSTSVTISYVSKDSIKLVIPSGINYSTNLVYYKSTPYTVQSPDTFHLKAPEIKYFTPSSGDVGTIVTIVGKYFKSGATTIAFGSQAATIKSINDTVIYCYVPGNCYGNSKIYVKLNDSSAESGSYFNSTNHKIAHLSPTLVSYKETVTVTGENFKPDMTWSLGTQIIIPYSVSATEIKFEVPHSLFYVPLKVTASYTKNYITSSSSSEEYLTLNDFELTSVTPLTGKPGDEITISGQNFNPNSYYVKVLFGESEATISNCSTTSIKVIVPDLPTGEYGITVTSADRSKVYPAKYINSSPWIQLNNLPFLYDYGCVFDFGEEIYVATAGPSSTEREIYSFDINTKGFNKITGTYSSSIIDPLSCTLNGMGYIIGQKASVAVGFELFNPDSLIWRKLPDYPGPQMSLPFIIAADSVIIAGGGRQYNVHYNYFKDLWKYSPKTNRWTQLASAPEFFGSLPSNQFYLNGKLYNVWSYYTWSYDFSDNTWARIGSSLMDDYGGTVSVNINGKWYLGGGNTFYIHNEPTGFTDFYPKQYFVYDPIANKWSNLSHEAMPPHSLAMYFTAGGYLFIGGSQKTHLYDFWMYDPSKE